jgi:hypothetical protein
MKTTLFAALLVAASNLAAQTYNIPGTSDLWLAGQPDGTTASSGDVAPAQSPVLISGIAGDLFYSFTVTGGVSNGPFSSGVGPDGGEMISHASGTENGISGLIAPINSLIGVFLNDNTPAYPISAPWLDFSTSGLDFTSLAPALNQSFFIGDGLTAGLASQTFLAPTGSTRLYLGTMDGYEWNNNSGSFSVTVAAIPEPSTYAVLFGVGVLAFACIRRRQS